MFMNLPARPGRALLKISETGVAAGTCPSLNRPKGMRSLTWIVVLTWPALLAQPLPKTTNLWDDPHSRASPAPARPSGAASIGREYFRRLRFSPDGKYVLAQSDTGIAVFSVDPFRVIFRVPAENASDAEFTADGQFAFLTGASHASWLELTYVNSPARVERWSVADRSLNSTKVGALACGTAGLSPDAQVVACVDFGGTLRLIDVASSRTFFERKKFCTKIVRGMGPSMRISGDPGSARIDFSPDSRYAIIAPKNADGSPLVWDLRSRKEVSLKGELKDLRWATYAFAGPDRLVVSRNRQGFVYNTWVSAIVALPSARTISKLKLPPGTLSRAADPGFIMVQAKVRRYSGEFPFRAIEYRTGRTIRNQTPAMDVFRDRYIVQRPGKGLELHVTPR
jgi:hypothetical protein